MRALAISLLVLLCAPRIVAAHGAKSQRSIVVQVEDDRALLLVTWTAPTGVLGRLMMIRAALSHEEPRRALSALMGKHALAPVEVRLDGRPINFDDVDSKLTLDTSSQRRHTITLLATVKLRGARSIEVRAQTEEQTRLLWTPAKAMTRRVKASRRAQIWSREGITLSVSPR